MTVPDEGVIYLDTTVVIYAVELHQRYRPLLAPLWRDARLGRLMLVTSELTLLEALVTPIRAGNTRLQRGYDRMLCCSCVVARPISRAVLRLGAELRAAAPPLRTPDAIHVATAQLESCTTFLTNDRRLRGVPGLPTLLLDDLDAV